MNALLPLLLLLPTVALPVSPLQGAREGERQGRAPVAGSRRAIDDLYADLREARDLADRVTDRSLRERLDTVLRRAERDLDRLDRENLPDRRPIGATSEEMTAVLRAVRSESFDNRRLELVKRIARDQRFTCAQARQVLALFDFDNNRADAAVALFPAIVDRGQFFTLRDVFDFGSNWDSVLKRTNQR